VADLRAPTPSAAAELAIPDIMTSLQQVEQYERRMTQCVQHNMHMQKRKLDMLAVSLERLSPDNKLKNQMLYLDSLQDRILAIMKQNFEKKQHMCELLLTRLNGLSPTAKLVGGYGYVETNGKALKSVNEIQEQDTLSVTLSDGRIETVVTKVTKTIV